MKYSDLQNKKLRQFLYLVLMLFASSGLKAQDFLITPTIACSAIDLTQIEVVPGSIPTSSIASYTVRWGIPNDTSVNGRIAGNDPSKFFSKVYLQGGDYTITVVIKKTDGTEVVLTKPRKIWNRPKTILTHTNQDSQCFKGNNYCFENKTIQGTAPLKRFYWTFGDGNFKETFDTTERTFCHNYNLLNAQFNVTLTVTDSVGCATSPFIDLESVKTIAIAPVIDAKFTITGTAQCDSSDYIFDNTTVTSFVNVRWFKFDYGDGTVYRSGPPNTNFDDARRFQQPYVHRYRKPGVFFPSLIIADRRSNCIDSFYYSTTGLKLPENIIYKVEMLAKRSVSDETVSDSVCFSEKQNATLTLYNKYDLEGAGGTTLNYFWNFNDPNANPPGTDGSNGTQFFQTPQPTYIYKGIGQFFPTLTIICPNLPLRPKTFNFFSKVDTLPFDKSKYQYEDYMAAPNATFGPNTVNPNSYILFPNLYSKSGSPLTTGNIQTKPNYTFINKNGCISRYEVDTIKDPTNPQAITGLYFRHVENISEPSSKWGYFSADTTFIPNYWDTVSITFTNPYTFTPITVPAIYEYYSPIKYRLTPTGLVVGDSIINGAKKIGVYNLAAFPPNPALVPAFNYNGQDFQIQNFENFKRIFANGARDSAVITIINNNWFVIDGSPLIGMGVNILGPAGAVEDPNTPVTIPTNQKVQCGPDRPVQFVNTTSTYQSNKLWIRWDFGEEAFAPACTSFSVPNPSAANGGKKPYANAGDLQDRTVGFFIANGKSYIGRMNNCNFSHDSLPTHVYSKWDEVFNYFKYGHDFPPYDTASWSSDYTSWPPTTPAPPGKNWVHPQDLSKWNKPNFPSNSVVRIDTMDMWPADIPVNNVITLGRDIPDPIAASKGQWYELIPAGTRIDSGNLLINLPKGRDGKDRRYRGNMLIPGTGKTLYRYAFDRQIAREITATLSLKDSLNNASSDPDTKLTKTKFDTIIAYNPITNRTDTAIIKDSLLLDDFDCASSGSVTLTFVKPDAFGLTQDGAVCPGFKNGSFGGDPQLIFDNRGYVDTGRVVNGAGILPPNSNRGLILINYDSLLDRNDLTPCQLDNWVDWQGANYLGAQYRGGLIMPGMFTRVNFPPLPPGPFTSPAGRVAFVHYFPPGSFNPAGVTAMPYDKRGWITLGLKVMSNADPLEGCDTATAWYHRFFRFINLEARFIKATYTDENPVITQKTSHCYLRGKGDDVTFHYSDSIQNNVLVDEWVWGDGTLTRDSFYYENPDDDIPINRRRYHFVQVETGEYVHTGTEDFPVGSKVYTEIKRDTIWYCDDPFKARPPQRIDTSVVRIDTSLMFLPITHRYYKSSFEMMEPDGNGAFKRVGAITRVAHNLYTNTGSKCKSTWTDFLTIGVIDTFDIKDASGKWDNTFCLGETVYFSDSIRYWYTSATCGPPDKTIPENFALDNDRANIHLWAYTTRYQADSIRNGLGDIFLIYDRNDYTVWPLSTAVCPVGYGNRTVRDIPGVGQRVFCYKKRNYFLEKVYWDFGDGTEIISDVNRNPPEINSSVTHKYTKPGKFKVSMYSIDSIGRWDTCVQYVNIVQPVAKIESKDVFSCGDEFKLKDSTVLINAVATRVENGITYYDTLDKEASWKWWFGDKNYSQFAPQSILENPTYDYRKKGKYRIKMEVTTQEGCKDTAEKFVLLQGPRPYIQLLSDSIGCVPYKVRVLTYPDRGNRYSNPPVFDASDTGSTQLTNIRSGRPDNLFVPVKYSTVDTVEFIYDQPGTYYIFSEGFEDISGTGKCPPVFYPDTAANFEKPITVRVNVPYKVDVEVEKDTICFGKVFTIKNLSDRDTINRYRMDIFDAANPSVRLDSLMKTNFPTDQSWTYKIFKKGRYKLLLESTKFVKGFGQCRNRDSLEIFITKTEPDFEVIKTGDGIYRLINKTDTTYSDEYEWKIYNDKDSLVDGFPKKFGNGNPLNDFVFDFNTDSSGTYKFCLISDVKGDETSCMDSLCKTIEVPIPPPTVRIPNVFTPNGDGFNDLFKIEITRVKTYELVITNRSGVKVFESFDPTYLWNGKTFNTGEDNPPGVYFYTLKYSAKGSNSKIVEVGGTLTLIR